MRTFILTSDLFDGEVEFVFGDNGLLLSHTFERSSVSEKQQLAILQRLPGRAEEVNKLVPANSAGKITEVVNDVTFEMFWRRYDDRINSSKKRTAAKWNKMTKGEQVKAYNFIYRYFNSIPSGTRKKYAETYLNAELWNN